MIIYNLLIYSGIFNITLGSVYFITDKQPTAEAIVLIGAMNILLVLIYVGFLELKDKFVSTRKHDG